MEYGIIELFIDNMKINFKKLKVQFFIEGEEIETDARKEVGNILFRASDVALSDLGKTIYYSEEEIEIPQQLVNPMLQMIFESSTLIAPAKRAIQNLLV